MGYGSYTLPSGKEAGYLVEATCEHPGCNERIDRGMGFACGGDAGDQGGCSCEGYFCGKHLFSVETLPDIHARTELGQCVSLCHQCTSQAAFLDWIEEAEQYRLSPQFAPNSSTLEVLIAEDCPHIETST
ncbi:MAG: hypothetical protein AB3N24_24730 [Leisingera sp.]